MLALAFLASCKKDAEQVVPEVEAAQAILSSISPKGAGVVDQLQQAAYAADFSKAYCEIEFDSTMHRLRTDANFIHDYMVTWNWNVQCMDGDADTARFNFISDGFYENSRLRSVDVSDGDLTVSQFNQSNPYYAISGEIIRVGNQQMKVRRQINFSSTITFIFSELLLNKTNLNIEGGRMTVSITGSKNTEGDFRYDGTLTFGNNKTASLVLDSGEVYQADW